MTAERSQHVLPAGYRLTAEGDTLRVYSHLGSEPIALKESESDGYLYVRVVGHNGRRESRFLHKLICFAHNGPAPTSKHEVRHLDGNSRNNSPANLAWGTRKENADDRERHGRTSRGNRHSAFIKAGLSTVVQPVGEQRPNSKLTSEEVSAIRVLAKEGWSKRGLARKFNVSESNIRQIVSGKRWTARAAIAKATGGAS